MRLNQLKKIFRMTRNFQVGVLGQVLQDIHSPGGGLDTLGIGRRTKCAVLGVTPEPGLERNSELSHATHDIPGKSIFMLNQMGLVSCLFIIDPEFPLDSCSAQMCCCVPWVLVIVALAILLWVYVAG